MLYTGNQWATARDNYVAFKRQHEARAERVRAMIVARALRHWIAAGMPGDKQTMYMAIHNTMGAIRSGDESGEYRGWAAGASRLDRRHIRQAYAILNREWEPSRILKRWAERMFPHYTKPEVIEYWLNKRPVD